MAHFHEPGLGPWLPEGGSNLQKPTSSVEHSIYKAQHMLIGASGSPPGFGWIFGFFGRFWSVWGPRGTFNPNPEFLPYRLDETDRSALSGGLGEFFCFIVLEGPFF